MLHPDSGIVSIMDIGVGDNALHCITDRGACCRGSDGGTSGSWILPGQTSEVSGSGDASNEDFSTSRGPSAVLLNRRDGAAGPVGLYRCRVLDARGFLRSLFIGVYGNTGGEITVYRAKV